MKKLIIAMLLMASVQANAQATVETCKALTQSIAQQFMMSDMCGTELYSEKYVNTVKISSDSHCLYLYGKDAAGVWNMEAFEFIHEQTQIIGKDEMCKILIKVNLGY